MSRLRTLLLVSAATAVALLGSAGPAQAHVTVASSTSEPGGYATVTFKVPNESETAATTGLSVDLPTETPFTSVLVQDIPGWTATPVTSELSTPIDDGHGGSITSAVTSIEWTATDAGIVPGHFGTFTLSVGPLPASGTVYLPTVQRYSDGSESDWVQQVQGSAEAEHPAPSITIGEPTTGGAQSADTTSAAASEPASDGGGWGVALGVTGIVLALGAGALAGVAFGRTRRLSDRDASDPADRRLSDHDVSEGTTSDPNTLHRAPSTTR